MFKLPVRADSRVFAVTLTATTPFPVPDDPLVIDNQLRSDVADQVHRDSAVTVTESAPPAAVKVSEVDDSVKVHGGGDGCVGDLSLHAQPAIAAADKSARTESDFRIKPLRRSSKNPAAQCDRVSA
jgi:hypothetical protein